MNSILTSIKKMLGIDEDYEVFDMDIITLINSIFAKLIDVGVVQETGYSITDKNNKWDEIISGPKLEILRTYMYLSVKMLFDPPQASSIAKATEETIKELEWRMNIAVDK